jgi:hypothetical protein
MEVIEILHDLEKQKMLSDSHLEFHGIPIEGAFFNLFAKFESLGFEESPIPRSENMMFMRKPSDDNDMAIMATIGEISSMPIGGIIPLNIFKKGSVISLTNFVG